MDNNNSLSGALESITNTLKNLADKFKPEIDYAKHMQNSLTQVQKRLQDYYATMKPVTEMYSGFLKQFADAFSKIAESSKSSRALYILSEAQYVRWDYYSKELIEEIVTSTNINKTLRLYHEKDNYKSVFETIEKSRNSDLIKNKKLFDDTVFAFENGKNNIAVLGFTALIDDALTVASDNDTTSIYKRANPLLEKLYDYDDEELNSDEYALMSLFYTFEKTMESFSANSDFSKPEPKGLNRHWIMHGRSKRRKTKLDCVKLINFLYGIILLDELANGENVGE